LVKLTLGKHTSLIILSKIEKKSFTTTTPGQDLGSDEGGETRRPTRTQVVGSMRRPFLGREERRQRQHHRRRHHPRRNDGVSML